MFRISRQETGSDLIKVLFNTMLDQCGIDTCHVQGCNRPATTLIEDEQDSGKIMVAGCCEFHYQLANPKNTWHTLTFVIKPPKKHFICLN